MWNIINQIKPPVFEDLLICALMPGANIHYIITGYLDDAGVWYNLNRVPSIISGTVIAWAPIDSNLVELRRVAAASWTQWV